MTPKIEVHFIITGRFNPDEFSKNIGINATSTWRSGEAVNKTLITRKFDGWKISTDSALSHDLDAEITKLIELIKPYRLKINNFCSRRHLNSEFSCVITTTDNVFPSIHLDRNLIDNIKAFNAEIDIDLY